MPALGDIETTIKKYTRLFLINLMLSLHMIVLAHLTLNLGIKGSSFAAVYIFFCTHLRKVFLIVQIYGVSYY